MSALPEDDAPTMTGTPGERGVEHALPPIDAGDGDDTTTAEAGPPTSRRAESVNPTTPDDTGDHDPHAHEDRTVQQKMEPPSRPPAPMPAAGAPPSAPLPSTEPNGAVATAPAVAPITQTNEIDSTDITDELAADLEEDAEPLEDSITATAPRLNHANLMDAAQSGRGVPIAIPGSVEIRSAEPDDMLDETEIRTLPGNLGPATLRASPAPAATGSAQAPPPPRPAAGRPPSSPDTEENDDDGITAQSLAPAMSAPDTAPQSRSPVTQASASSGLAALAQRAASPRPAAGMPFQPDVVDEPATRPGVEGAEEPATRPGVEGVEEPATRPGLGESPTRPGQADPETAERLKRADVAKGYANDDDDDDDESITARGRVAEPYDEEEESVTTQAPPVPTSVIEDAIKKAKGILDVTLDDGTDGTTQRVNKTRKRSDSSPADGEAESITTQAPGPLTNILRVIASGSSPSLGSDPALPLLDDDELPENRTAVMANAPLKRVLADHASSSPLPAIRPTGGPLLHGPQGSAAPRLEPSSESGLRVARAGGVDRASLGALGLVGDANARSSGVGPHAKNVASDGSISAPIDRSQMNGDVFPAQVQPSVHEVDLGKGPRYGLLVAIVAVISIVVPVSVFFLLHHSGETAAAPGVPAEPASEIEKHDGTRVKAVRGKNGQMTAPSASVAPSASASAAPAASASSKPGTKGFPFRR